jgi:hypothetical protein
MNPLFHYIIVNYPTFHYPMVDQHILEYPMFEYKGVDGYYYNGIHLPDIVYIIDNTISLLNHNSLNNLRELLGDNFVNRVKGHYIIIIEDNNH